MINEAARAPEPRRKRLRRIAVGLNLALVVLLLAGFIYYGNLDQILSILATASWSWFVLAVVVGLLSSLASSARLWMLVHMQGIRIRLPELFAINVGVRFYSFFSPLSSVGSVMRWIRLIPAGKSAEGFAALAANRFFETAIPLSMGGLWALSSYRVAAVSLWLFPAYLLAILILVWAALHFSEAVSRVLVRRQAGTSSRVIGTLLSAATRLLGSLERFRKLSSREIAALVGLALLSDIIGLLGHVLVARSIGLPIAFTDIGWIRAIMLLVALAPFTLPGGFGLREVSTIVLVTALGIDLEHATAYSILLYSRLFIVALIGGLVELAVNLRTFGAGLSS